MEYIKLNNGTNIPALGFGTWCIDDGKAAEARGSAPAAFPARSCSL